VIEILSRAPKLDPVLENVDRLASRWAAAERTSTPLHPLEAIRLLHDGAVLGGGPIPTADDILAFDRCLHQAPDRDKAVINLWYTTSGSAEQKAKRIGISRAQFYTEWGRTLSYFRGWLRAHAIDV
jgi:hypothetical protein